MNGEYIKRMGETKEEEISSFWRTFSVCVITRFVDSEWPNNTGDFQPRSGARIQPSAKTVGERGK